MEVIQANHYIGDNKEWYCNGLNSQITARSTQENNFMPYLMNTPSFENDYCFKKCFKVEISSKEIMKNSQDDEESSSLCPQYSELKGKSSPRKFQRWGNREDIELFKLIHSDEIKGIISLNEILQMEDEKKMEKNVILQELRERSGWKYGLKAMVDRIKGRMHNKFTKRQEKYLKILVKQQRYQPVYEDIIIYFPGKTLEAIKVVCDAICREKRKKRLNDLDVNSELKKMNILN